ncbi:MAG: aminodeoxychorismate/anthranilate synthase component II [Pseudomonadota bacterium]
MILLIDNYDSFTYNLVHFLGDLGAACEVVRNDKISVEAAMATAPDAIVLSPGPCTPNEAGICVDLVTAAAGKIPLLGVCLGHQAIAQAYGAEIVRAPKPMHGKLSHVRNRGESLFAELPQRIEVTRYHSLTVAPESLPPSLKVTADTSDGVIMGLMHETDNVHGVQFHPESIKTEFGHQMLANFLTAAGLTPRRPNRSAAA